MVSKASPPEPGKPVKLSKANIDLMVEPGIYPDTELKGFRLRVGTGSAKSYQLVGKVKGQPKTIFVTIGKHGNPWTPDTARTEAGRLRLLMGQGVNPNALTQERRKQAEAAELEAKAQQEARELTLRAAFDELLKKQQRKSTEKSYRAIVYKHFKDWLDKPLVDISKDDITKRYDKIASGSKSSAAHAMRILRAIIYAAQIKHGDDVPELLKVNPVKSLAVHNKYWDRIDPRHEHISDEDMPAFYQAVMELGDGVPRDYLLVALFTGLRRSEICTLKWDGNIDLRKSKRMITISGDRAKNHQRHELAMSDFVYELFRSRWEKRDSEYVFPGRVYEDEHDERKKDGHFDDPTKAIERVIQSAEIEPFTSHSLRRTFATAAKRLKYDPFTIGRLLNHKGSSVTEKHYIQSSVEDTREPMQRIAERLLGLMTAEAEPSNVVPLVKASAR